VTATQAEPAPAVDAADYGEGAPEPIASTPHRPISVLNRYRALLLDSTYRPVGVANWQRAVCLDLADKADVLEYYSEDVTVRSVREEFYLPAVLRVRTHRSKAQHTVVSLSRSNILLRDRYQCQYCGSGRELTIDHVVPQSKGGENTWENLVACCASCNSKKGSKSLEQLRWKLRQVPKEPSIHEIDFLLSMLLGSNNHELLPEQWQAYILPFKSKGRLRQQHAG
jgi:5-methylcytosine-specific restriction endonuclease McrA